MILSGQSIRKRGILSPFAERTHWNGRQTNGHYTYGLGPAGYDVRLELNADKPDCVTTLSPGAFILGATIERFTMPDDLLAIVHDKSSWARRGLCIQNTVIEPGWCGHLTLELTNHSDNHITLESGCPIAQIIFHLLDKTAEKPYDGKYQNQARGPQQAI